jgi:hypothetical protein
MTAEFVGLIANVLPAICIFGMWTLIFYKENPWSRFLEYSAIGLGIGYATITTTQNFITYVADPAQAGSLAVLAPIVLGVLAFLGMYIRKYRWMLMYPISVTIGINVGYRLATTAGADILMQLRSLAVPLTGTTYQIIDGIVLIISAVSTMFFFTFTGGERKGVVKWFSNLGLYLLMIGLGTMFAALFLGHLGYLLAGVEPILRLLGVIKTII